MKIKPKKITNRQIEIVKELVKGKNESQLKKVYSTLNFPQKSVMDLSFIQARILIETLSI